MALRHAALPLITQEYAADMTYLSQKLWLEVVSARVLLAFMYTRESDKFRRFNELCILNRERLRISHEVKVRGVRLRADVHAKSEQELRKAHEEYKAAQASMQEVEAKWNKGEEFNELMAKGLPHVKHVADRLGPLLQKVRSVNDMRKRAVTELYHWRCVVSSLQQLFSRNPQAWELVREIGETRELYMRQRAEDGLRAPDAEESEEQMNRHLRVEQLKEALFKLAPEAIVRDLLDPAWLDVDVHMYKLPEFK